MDVAEALFDLASAFSAAAASLEPESELPGKRRRQRPAKLGDELPAMLHAKRERAEAINTVRCRAPPRQPFFHCIAVTNCRLSAPFSRPKQSQPRLLGPPARAAARS